MPTDLEFEVPDEVHERLLMLAAERSLSLSDYLLLRLREAVEDPFLPKLGQRPKNQSDGEG